MPSQNPSQSSQPSEFFSFPPPNISPSTIDATMTDDIDHQKSSPLPALAEQPNIQQAFSTEEAVVARDLADNRINAVVRNNTGKLDDLFRGHKDKTHVINTNYRELIEAKGAELETDMQTVVDQFLGNIRTTAAGGFNMARIEELCGEMQTNVLLQLGKHQKGMKELKNEDKKKLDKLGRDDTKQLMIIQNEGETALKGVIDGIFNKAQAFSFGGAEEAIKKIKRKSSKDTKSRAGKGLNKTTNLAVQQPTHLQLALGPRIVLRHAASLPTRPTVGIFSRPASTNITTNIFTRPDPPATPTPPYTEDLVKIKKEDFYLDADAETALLNETPTKKPRVDFEGKNRIGERRGLFNAGD